MTYNTSIEDLAYHGGFELIETVSRGGNGYPRNIRKAIIGFPDMDDAQHYADKFGLTIYLLHKRDGWHFYERLNTTTDPLRITSVDYGDDYESFSARDLDTYFENNVKDMLTDFDNFEDLENFLKKHKDICEEIEMMNDDQLVITHNGIYYETIDQSSMQWSHDTHTYVIGLVEE